MEKEEAKQHMEDRKEYEARELLDAERDNSEWDGETAEDKWRTDAYIDADKEYDAHVDNLEGERQVPMEYFNEFLIEWSDLSFEKRHLVSGKVASHIHEILGGCDEDWAMDTARDICEREFPHWIKISICKDVEELCI